MVNIFETELLEKKTVRSALSEIYGINFSTAYKICKKLGFSCNLKINNLSEDQITNILLLMESMNLVLANDLKKYKSMNYTKIVSIKSYKGLRKLLGLPVRGQRTHTNAKIAKKLNKKFKKLYAKIY